MSRSRSRDDWKDLLVLCNPTSSNSGEGGHQVDVHGVHQERAHHARSSEYGPEQRVSQENLNNGDAHTTGPGQASYSHNTLLATPTFSNDSGDGTLDDLTTYSEEYQYSMLQPIEDPTTYMPTPGHELSGYYTQQSHQQNSPAIEPSVDCQMTFDFDIDFNVDFDPGPLEVDSREEAPWSPENYHNENSRPPVAQVTSWADLVGASQTSSASYNSGGTSNLVSSSADTAGDGEDPDWGESSVATVRPVNPRHGNPYDHTRHASNHVNYGEQEQGCPIMPTGHVVVPQSAYQFSIPDRTAVQSTSLRELDPDGIHLHVLDPETSYTRPSSSASSAMSDPVQCHHCSAQFTGVHRRGNYGRHRRQKHRGRPIEIACEAEHCDKVFQRPDARLKHYRSRHPQLVQRRQ